MAMRSKLLAFCTFLILSVDPVAAARVQTNHESRGSESNMNAVNMEEEWFARGDRCVRLQRNFNTAVSRVRTKANRASQHPGIVSSASLVMTLRRLNRNFKLAAERECSWVSDQDADTNTMISVAHENLDSNPCLPQAQALMTGVDQSNAEELSTVAVQAVHMLISGDCTTVVEVPTEETDEQPAIGTEAMEALSDDALDDVADAALGAEDEQADGSVFVEQDLSLEQKPIVVVAQPGQVVHAGQIVQAHPQPAVQPAAQPAMPPQRRESTAVQAVVGIILFILSIGLLCAAGPAVMAVISLIIISIMVLFLAFFYTFIAVALQANPATGNQWLASYLHSTWRWTTSAVGGQLTNGAHWFECFAYLR